LQIGINEFITLKSNLWLNPNFAGNSTAKDYEYYIRLNHLPVNQAKQNLSSIPDIEWLVNLPVYLEFKSLKNKQGRHLVVTHSSISKVWHYLDKMNTDEIYRDSFLEQAIWARPKIINDIPSIFNAFGHSPVYSAVLRDHYVNLDSGCYLGHKKSQGYSALTAIQFPEMEIFTQKFCE
jgi:serine/threonine protein phosphatase 1